MYTSTHSIALLCTGLCVWCALVETGQELSQSNFCSTIFAGTSLEGCKLKISTHGVMPAMTSYTRAIKFIVMQAISQHAQRVWAHFTHQTQFAPRRQHTHIMIG